jgi:probable rRNA maturation factor
LISFHDTVDWNNNLDYNSLESMVYRIIGDYNKDLASINFVFCSDDFLLDINRKYLKHDYYTDVITFDYEESIIVSDVYISIDRVRENAKDRCVSFMNELCRVVFHAVLHLCGLVDKSKADELHMRSREDYYLSVFVSRET